MRSVVALLVLIPSLSRAQIDASVDDAGSVSEIEDASVDDAGVAPSPQETTTTETTTTETETETETTTTTTTTNETTTTEAPTTTEPATTEPATTQEPAKQTVVRARQPRQAASSTTARDRDFLQRPHPRPADILSTAPGFYVVQHSGGGKANQYFLRGFDADHGTDVAISFDGVPVNLVSHGHGQGYTDVNFVIPEVVRRVDVKKGPYFTDVGDFGTAGAVNMESKNQLERSSVSGSLGAYASPTFFDHAALSYRGLVLVTPDVGVLRPFLAGEINYTDGPFANPERFQRFNLFGKVPIEFGDAGRVTVSATSYGGGWNGSGQVPLREVEAGHLDRFDTIDPTEGGATQRHSAYALYESPMSDDGQMTVLAYAVHYRWSLFSNFTFFSTDPENGDQIEQTDVRTYGGVDARYRFRREALGLTLSTETGLQLRSDLIDNTLHNDVKRQRLSTVVDAQVGESALAIFVEEEIALPPWLRLVVGVRGDGFNFQVRDRLEVPGASEGATSGVETAAAVSPKASLIGAWPGIGELYLNAGVGFHSNDARGVVRENDPVTPLTRAYGYEIGARTKLFDTVEVAGSVFGLNLDGETVWVGDEGTTELRGPTLRLGVEGEVRSKLYFDWLFADLNGTFTSATFVDNAGNGNAVALAPTVLVDGGVSVYGLGGFFGRVGAVYIGDRPATEDRFISAEGFFRVDTALGSRNESFELALDVQNVLNTEWREAQFANVSRLQNEAAVDCPSRTRPASDGGTFLGCEDLHFTPGSPLNGRLTATVFF